MAPPPSCAGSFEATDTLINQLLHAESPAASDAALIALMAEAAPVILRVARGRAQSFGADEVEDLASEARTQLTLRLQRLRWGGHEAGTGDSGRPITNFPAYAATVAYTAWADRLRARYPARAMLLNRLRYLLENRTRQSGFSLWMGANGERWCGFQAWCAEARPASQSPRRQWLLADPGAAAADVFGSGAGWSALPLPELVARLLTWLDGPLELRELTDVLAELLPLKEAAGTSDAAARAALPATPDLADASPSPSDALRWKEYLLWLWRETARLTRPQRLAFLLHSNLLRELELIGQVSLRVAASALALPVEQMAQYWTALPLDDRTIAALLAVERQQVINLRKVARGILGRAWQQWLHEK